ncbi:DUF2239 family protein [Kerstersia sp.]|uniref:DUF2239 family protein n=1 Tax=Kerstersia sp. TaxID=1930783 RepID=UPI003F93DC44
MTKLLANTYTTFAGHRRLASGALAENALAAWRARAAQDPAALLTFDDATGRTVEVNLQGTEQEVAARFETAAITVKAAAPEPQDEAADAAEPAGAGQRGRGRPKLGVVAREVTLLPRHWEWLATQPGGASVALRKLVEDARRTGAAKDLRRQAQERAYHFMSAVAGDLPGYEEATRALFAGDALKMSEQISAWPEDVRAYALRLAFGDTSA